VGKDLPVVTPGRLDVGAGTSLIEGWLEPFKHSSLEVRECEIDFRTILAENRRSITEVEFQLDQEDLEFLGILAIELVRVSDLPDQAISIFLGFSEGLGNETNGDGQVGFLVVTVVLVIVVVVVVVWIIRISGVARFTWFAGFQSILTIFIFFLDSGDRGRLENNATAMLFKGENNNPALRVSCAASRHENRKEVEARIYC
jgi:hypothetical protein